MKEFTCFFLFVLFSFSIMAQLSPDTLALLDEYVELADVAYEKKDYKQAAIYYEKSLKIDDNSNGLARLTAESYAQSGDAEKAIEYLEYFIRVQKGYGFTSFSKDIEENELFNPIKKLNAYKKTIADLKQFEVAEVEKERQYVLQLKKQQQELEVTLPHQGFFKKLHSFDAPEVYKAIQNYNDFPQLKPTEDQCLFLWYQLNDTLEMPFTMMLPKNYDSSKTYPVIIAMHGAVWAIEEIGERADQYRFYSTSRYIYELVEEYDMIALAPFANRDFNWLYPFDGFQIVPNMLRKAKQFANIDDNRVHLTGHSNGAAGSFNYLVKAPSQFAGFYGLNTKPKVYEAGTFLKNAKNRHFYNIATDKDYYYPPNGIDSIEQVAKRLGITWDTDLYRGFPHWFPQFSESKIAVEKMFTHTTTRKRNAYQNDLYWECDRVENGQVDWIEITALDTLATKADWQKTINFPIKGWVDVEDESKIIDTTKMAFDFPYRSGAIQAHYEANTFTINTSRVGGIKIYCSPKMVNFEKEVEVIINEQSIFKGKIELDKTFMIEQFEKEFDRKVVWGAVLEFEDF